MTVLEIILYTLLASCNSTSFPVPNSFFLYTVSLILSTLLFKYPLARLLLGIGGSPINHRDVFNAVSSVSLEWNFVSAFEEPSWDSSPISSSLVFSSTGVMFFDPSHSSVTSGLKRHCFLRHCVHIFCPTLTCQLGKFVTSSSVACLKPDFLSTVWTDFKWIAARSLD